MKAIPDAPGELISKYMGMPDRLVHDTLFAVAMESDRHQTAWVSFLSARSANEHTSSRDPASVPSTAVGIEAFALDETCVHYRDLQLSRPFTFNERDKESRLRVLFPM